eukprot:4642285-Pyramimonas_sp.AAC.1
MGPCAERGGCTLPAVPHYLDKRVLKFPQCAKRSSNKGSATNNCKQGCVLINHDYVLRPASGG